MKKIKCSYLTWHATGNFSEILWIYLTHPSVQELAESVWIREAQLGALKNQIWNSIILASRIDEDHQQKKRLSAGGCKDG